MPGSDSRIVWKAALRFTAMIASQVSTGISASGAACCKPAQLTRMSGGEAVASAVIIDSMAGASRRSTATCRAAVAPVLLIDSSAVAICSEVPSPTITTFAPAEPNACAIARPMPEVPPVTRAVRPMRKVSVMVQPWECQRPA